MAEAIVYCDQCSKMIAAADIKSGDAITTPGGTICAACLAALDPERQAALRKLATEGPKVRRPSGIAPAPKRPPTRRTALPPSARQRSGHTAQYRPAVRPQGTKPKSGMVVLAGIGVGLVAGILALIVFSSGSKNKGRGRRRPALSPTTSRLPAPRSVPASEGDTGPRVPQRGGLARLAGPPPPGVHLTRPSGRPAVMPPTTPAAPMAEPDLTRGLVAHWTFDEEDGVAVPDASGAGPSGSLENVDPADARVPGKVGGALRLDGVDDCVRFPCDRVLSDFTDFTLAAWVMPDDTSTDYVGDPIISNESEGRGYQLTWHKDGRFGFMLANVHMTWSLPGKVNGNWYHVAAVFAGGTSRLYVNGVEEAKAYPSYRANTTERLYVGAFVGRERFLKATVDDVRVYSRGLMPTEIVQLYRGPEAAPPASAEATEGVAPRTLAEGGPGAADLARGLVGHWALDEEGGTRVPDSSGNAADGELHGSPEWRPEGGRLGGALAFNAYDGSDDYAELPSSAELDRVQENDYTLAAWVKAESAPRGDGEANDAYYAVIVKCGRHMGLQYRHDMRFGLSHWLSGDEQVLALSTGKFPPGSYHHVAGVVSRAAGTATLYVDGRAVGSRSFDPGVAAWSFGKTSWRIGVARPEAKTWRWGMHGEIDDVRIYGRALSATEVAVLCAMPDEPAGTAPPARSPQGPTGLVGHWEFDDAEGSTAAADSTPNGNDGRISGARSTEGKIGRALLFEGKSYVEIPNDRVNLKDVQEGDYTLAAWVKPNSAPQSTGKENQAFGVVMKSGFHAGLSYEKERRFCMMRWFIDGNVFCQSKVHEPGTFCHVAGVVRHEAGRIEIYVDGELEGSRDFTPGRRVREHAGQTWKIGTGATRDRYRWAMDGVIDDVRIYNRALAPEEVRSLFEGSQRQERAPTPSPEAVPEPEWVSIFNGLDMSGWQKVGVGSARVEDGVLVAEDNADLFYEAGWAEFALSFELKADGKGETAAGLRLAHAPRGRPNFRVQAKFHRDGDLRISDRNGRLWQSGAHWFPLDTWMPVKLVVKRGSLGVYRGESLLQTVSLAGAPAKSGGVYFNAPAKGVVRLRNVRVAVHSHVKTDTSPEHPPAPAGPVDLSRGLVAHWPLDELRNGATPDASGNGHDGRAVGEAVTAAGRVGGALSFNGTDSYVEVASGLEALHLADLTIAFWLKPASLEEWQVLVAKRHDGKYAPYWTALRNGVFRFSWSYDTEPHWVFLDSTPGAVAAGEWTHVAVSRDCTAGDVLLYVNGERNAEMLGHRPGARVGGTKPSQQGMKVTLGSRFIQNLNVFGRWFKGELDDVRIYGRPLGAAEIAAVHDGARSEAADAAGEGHPDPEDPSLAGHWRFDESRGPAAADSSPLSNHGTMKGGVTFVGDGRRRGAFHFDGEGDRVDVPASPSLDLPGDLTLAMWLRRSPSPPGEFKVVAKPSQFALSANNEGGVQFGYSYVAGGSFANWFEGGVVTGRWVHLAVARDATAKEVSLYVNGSLEETCRVRGPAGRSTSGLAIGDGFFGDIDDVCVYGRVLGTAEIRALCGVDVVRKGHGLLGRYYDNASLTGEPVLTRVDSEIDFDWGKGSPDPAVPADGFSVRWTGWLVPVHSEKYTFELRHNDGARLWIDGDLVIDKWKDGKIRSKGSKALQAGQRHAVKLELYERVLSAVAQLRWKSRSQPIEIVPRSCLFPDTGR